MLCLAIGFSDLISGEIFVMSHSGKVNSQGLVTVICQIELIFTFKVEITLNFLEYELRKIDIDACHWQRAIVVTSKRACTSI